MRLKTLRRQRSSLEIEGAVISGSRMDLANEERKYVKHRSNTSFVLPASLNTNFSSLSIVPTNQSDELNTNSQQDIVMQPNISQASTNSSYQALEAAYLEHGIRIRVSPTKQTTGQQSARKSANNVHRRTSFVSRYPSRTSSVLHYTTNTQHFHSDTRSFSALQQTSSNEFEPTQAPYVSCAPSPEINEETIENYCTTSIVVSDNSNPTTPPDKLTVTNDAKSLASLIDNDPDLAYMSSLLQKPAGDSYRETIRRRAGLRGTFAVHRHPLIANSHQSQEKSLVLHQNSLTRNATVALTSTQTPKKIDQDILKHVSRIQRTSISRDYSLSSPRTNATPNINSTPMISDRKRNSTSKSLKSVSLEPLELLLSPAPRSASLSIRDLPSIKTTTIIPNPKPSKRRINSTKTRPTDNQNPKSILLKENTNIINQLRDNSLSLMKTSPLGMVGPTNSIDSGCFDRSSSGDFQSLKSSSIVHIASSIQSGRFTDSTIRRPTTNKRVSFYEEPKAIILTTATYV